MKFVLASNNIKISEMRRILKNCAGRGTLSLADVGYIYDIEENGKTLLKRAHKSEDPHRSAISASQTTQDLSLTR